MRSTLTGIFLFSFLFNVFIPNHAPAETVQGHYCYTYGDKESLMEAKALTRTLAIRNAIESYRAHLTSTTNVKDFVLTNDIIQMISSGYMKNIEVIEHKEEGRTICEMIQANVSPEVIENVIKREVGRRTKKIEERGIDNNGYLKILSSYRNYSQYAHSVDVIVRALKHINDGSYSSTVFIECFDSNGNPIKGKSHSFSKLYLHQMSQTNFDIPVNTVSYKLWLGKSEETAPPKNSKKRKPRFVPIN